MTKINKVGIELEGLFDPRPTFKGKWKRDSSVIIDGRDGENDDDDFCDGSCRDDCNCADHCECEQCRYCGNCDMRIDRCCCSGCNYCDDCDNRISECQCVIERDPNCPNANCTAENRCSYCKEVFSINRNISTDCNNGEYGTYNGCDLQSCGCECSCECDGNHNDGVNIGEFVSIPLNLNEIEEWVKVCYPKKTNSTCGGHIHVSLKSYADYMSLMDREFYEYYLKRMEAWGKKSKINEGSSFWKRLKGAQYCYAKFMPCEQRDMTDHYEDPRYAQINYCFNVDNRHTVEFRMLPCFQKYELMISGIKETIDIIETYLSGINDNNNMITLRIEC